MLLAPNVEMKILENVHILIASLRVVDIGVRPLDRDKAMNRNDHSQVERCIEPCISVMIQEELNHSEQ